jgi:hypothetical protein
MLNLQQLISNEKGVDSVAAMGSPSLFASRKLVVCPQVEEKH